MFRPEVSVPGMLTGTSPGSGIPVGDLVLAGGESAASQRKEPGTLAGVAQGLSSDVILFPDFGRSSGNN